MKFDLHCRKCPRLSTFLDEVGKNHPDYHARPVAPFGDDHPSLLVVGLAPGMHGANRTGRPFTGDHAGILLYETLHRHGFSSSPVSGPGDDLRLVDCRITNAVKCLPPANKPETSEIRTCNAYLCAEISDLKDGAAILALGTIAHNAVLTAIGKKAKDHPFGHGRVHEIGRWMLYDSYHCSRYNTQTKRLTAEMFGEVFASIRNHLEKQACPM
ncbi:MAG: uracil-DNA glycosylase [Burkholderiales bacterium]|nr:uracil-DNA glycosylase [Burkholderiales bacterium]